MTNFIDNFKCQTKYIFLNSFSVFQWEESSISGVRNCIEINYLIYIWTSINSDFLFLFSLNHISIIFLVILFWFWWSSFILLILRWFIAWNLFMVDITLDLRPYCPDPILGVVSIQPIVSKVLKLIEYLLDPGPVD